MVSAWSENQDHIPFNGIIANLNMVRKNTNKVVFPIQLYLLPYYSKYSKGSVMKYVLDIDMDNLIPQQISLSSNYPNPFNPLTKIEFSINKPSVVSIKVFDIIGREIRTLVDGYFQPGSKVISWDGKNYSGKKAGAGVYIYQLETYQTRISKKMVLLK